MLHDVIHQPAKRALKGGCECRATVRSRVSRASAGENGARHDIGEDEDPIPLSAKRKRSQLGEGPGERGESPPARVNPARWGPGGRDGGSDSRAQ